MVFAMKPITRKLPPYIRDLGIEIRIKPNTDGMSPFFCRPIPGNVPQMIGASQLFTQRIPDHQRISAHIQVFDGGDRIFHFRAEGRPPDIRTALEKWQEIIDGKR